jgi:hypothetical protein
MSPRRGIDGPIRRVVGIEIIGKEDLAKTVNLGEGEAQTNDNFQTA